MEYIKSFLVGGSVIAGAKFVSKYTNPIYGSIIGGVPTGIIASFFLPDSDKKQYYQGYAYHSVILALTVNIIYQIILHFSFYHTLTCLIGLIIWGVISFLIAKDYLLP